MFETIGKTREEKQRQIQKSSEGMSKTGEGIKSDLALIKEWLLRLYIRSTDTECKNKFMYFSKPNVIPLTKDFNLIPDSI